MENFRINNQITAPELRVIDELGKNLGVLTLEDAKRTAEEKGLDLILIVPNTNPPVAKIQSFDKFRYEKEKEFKKQRKSVKVQELKQVQISPKEGKNDLTYKLKRLEEFLAEGDKVVIVMVLRGREKSMQDFARGKLQEFLALITTPYRINQDIKFAGRGLAIQIEKQ